MTPITHAPFRDRAEAARRLAEQLKDRPLRNPLVLAIPRGGVLTGAALARELHAELDVVLSRRLRSPIELETAIGAVSEDGRVVLDHDAWSIPEMSESYVEMEKRHQMADIEHRRELVRAVRPPAPIAGRSVIVTDDGIATGSSMLAALRTVRDHGPHELLVAVPIASAERLAEVRRQCDAAFCLLSPDEFWTLGQFYDHFEPVPDDEVVRVLREASPVCEPGTPH